MIGLRISDCSCPIYRVLGMASSDDESLNYKAVSVQLRNS